MPSDTIQLGTKLRASPYKIHSFLSLFVQKDQRFGNVHEESKRSCTGFKYIHGTRSSAHF